MHWFKTDSRVSVVAVPIPTFQLYSPRQWLHQLLQCMICCVAVVRRNCSLLPHNQAPYKLYKASIDSFNSQFVQ